MKDIVVGLFKSWTVWLGAALVAFPEWWPLVEPFVRDIIGPEHYVKLVPLAGIAMVLLRLKTTESIKAKGTV